MDPEAPVTPAHLATPALRALHYWTPGPQKAEAMTVSTKHAASSPVASPGRAKMRENAAGSRIPVTTTTTTTTTASESEGGAITADVTMAEATMAEATVAEATMAEAPMAETTMFEADIASEAAMVEAAMAEAALANPEVTKQPLFMLLDYSKKLKAHLKEVRALNDQMKALYVKNPTR